MSINLEKNTIKVKSINHKNKLYSAVSLSLYTITPFSIRSGISTASQGASPNAIAWAMPNFGTFLAQSGLK